MAKLSVREAQEREFIVNGGFRIIEIEEPPAEHIPGEDFGDVVMTTYVDPDFLQVFAELVSLETAVERRDFISDCARVYPSSIYAMAAQTIRGLGPQKGKQFLNELNAFAPERDWNRRVLNAVRRGA